MNDDRQHRHDRLEEELARLETRRQEMEARLDAQRQRIDERFERANQLVAARDVERASERQRIVSVALDLLDEVGLNDLTLRKLATRLGLKAPTLYWYFQNKAELIDYMAEAILHAEFATLEARRDDQTWQEWLTGVCHRLRTALLSRRDGARVVVGVHFDPGRSLMRLYELTLQSLTTAGVELRQARVVMLASIFFVMTCAIEEQSGPTEEEVSLAETYMRRSTEFPLLAQAFAHTMDERAAVFNDALRLIIGDVPSV